MFQPRYEITAPMLSAIAVIENARGHIDAAPILPEAQVSLCKQSTVESINSSTQIEGNPLTGAQVAAALADHQVDAQRRAVLEVKNYARAWDWVRGRSSGPVTTAEILRVHALTVAESLPAEKVGQFRAGPVWVVNSVNGVDQVAYTAPDADSVPALLVEVLTWLNATDAHPLIRAGLAHAYLAAVHPFADGNGRVARLVARLILGRAGYGFRDALVLESFYAQDRPAYYAAIDLGDTWPARAAADATGWLIYFLRGFVTSVARLAEQVAVLAAVGTPPARVRVSADQATLLAYAVREGGISLAEAATVVLGMPRRTLQRTLRSLVEAGLLQPSGAGRATRYLPRRER